MIPIHEFPQLHSDTAPEQLKSIESLRVCLATVGDQTFAIDLREVREVFEPESIRPVPGMPAALAGVTNLRGTIIPLIDVRVALGLSTSTLQKYAVVVRHDAHQIGILVEQVPEIHVIQSNDLKPSLTRTATERHPLFSSTFTIESRSSAILDVAQLLAMLEGDATDQNPLHREE